DVGRLAEGELLAARRSTDLADHYRSRVYAHANGEDDSALSLQPRAQRGDRLEDADAGADRPARVVLPRRGVAEVDEKPIAEILGDIAVKLADDDVAGFLVRADHLAEDFGIDSRRELGRAHEVAEHHRELAALRLRGLPRSRWPGGGSRG